jgi:hypothetical protein
MRLLQDSKRIAMNAAEGFQNNPVFPKHDYRNMMHMKHVAPANFSENCASGYSSSEVSFP